jgi:hypothetical protein
MVKKITTIAVASLLGLSLLAMAPVAQARTSDRSPGVVKHGSCSGQATWKLHVSPENGRLQVEFEVHQATAGDRWRVRINENGAQLWSGTKVTQSDGSFDVKHGAHDTSGPDKFVVKATNASTGETCVGKATY